MPHKVITIAQQKGGAGKTTVAAHLAVALAQKGRRVAVIDIDPQGSLGHWHRVREKRFGEGYTGLTFASISGWRVASEVTRLKKMHDYIVIDSPPHTETEARTAIRAADLLIIPIQPSPTDLWASQATIDLAHGENIPVKVLLNRFSPHSKLAQQIAAEVKEQAKTQFGNRVLFASALLEGRTATEIEPASHAALEVKGLVGEILEMFEPPVVEEDETETETIAKPKGRRQHVRETEVA